MSACAQQFIRDYILQWLYKVWKKGLSSALTKMNNVFTTKLTNILLSLSGNKNNPHFVPGPLSVQFCAKWHGY